MLPYTCDHCGTICKGDPYEQPELKWLFVGDERNRMTVLGHAFGVHEISVRVPRTLQFCSHSCAVSWLLEAVSAKLDKQERSESRG